MSRILTFNPSQKSKLARNLALAPCTEFPKSQPNLWRRGWRLFCLWSALLGVALWSGGESGQAGSSQPTVAPHRALVGRALASADFNEDGVADVVSGYAVGSNGTVTLSLGRGTQAGTATASEYFAPSGRAWAAPVAVDFLGAGDFNADGHADLVLGARGGAKLVWWAGDGRGHFTSAGASDLPGALTALAVGEMNRADGLPEVIAGVGLANGAGGVLVLEGPNGAGQAQAEVFATSAPVSGLAVGALEGDALPDVVAAAGQELLLIAGRDRKLSLRAEEQATVRPAQVSTRSFPTALRDVAVGEFTGDGRLDVAVLTAAGAVNVLRQPTAAKAREWAAWRMEEAAAGGAWAGVGRLIVARRAGGPVAGVLGLAREGGAMRELRREAQAEAAWAENGSLRLSATRWAESPAQDLDAAAAVLPLRVNGDALDDVVVLRTGASGLVVIPNTPAGAIITVNSTLDTNARDNFLTLREAILLANGELLKSALTPTEQLQVSGTPAPGLDEVRFNIAAGNRPEEETAKLAISAEGDGNGAVSDESRAPSSRTNAPQVNFIIAGNVKADGVNLAGATVRLTGGQTGSFTTGADGNYSFSVPAGGNYTVTVYKNGYTFNPVAQSFTNLGVNQTANFQNGVPLCAPPPAGLVAFYKGENNVVDLVTLNTGSLMNGATFADGKSGRAFSLDGSNDYVQMSDNTSNSVTGQITIQAWIKPNNAAPSQEVINKYEGANNQRSYFVTLENGNLTFWVSQTGAPSNFRSVTTPNSPITAGVYSHIAMTFNPSTQVMKIYVNGIDTNAPVHPESLTINSIFDSTAPLRFGTISTQNGFFGGQIDEAQIYNRALSASEIAAIYNAGSAGVCQLTTFTGAGLLDTTFNGTGKITTPIGSDNDYAYAVAIQPDGKIVAAGSLLNPNYNFALVRYNADGTLDTSFDGDGKVITAPGNGSAQAQDLAIQPDGKIVVAGYTFFNGINIAAVVRYNPNGSLDTSFDSDGVVRVTGANVDDNAQAVAIQPDGKIVVAGSTRVAGSADNSFFFRLNPNGSLDSSFDGDGMVTIPVSTASTDTILGVVIQPDGKIVGAGYAVLTVGGNDRVAVVRLNTNGSLDTNFDGDGIVTTVIGSGHSNAVSVALQTDGKIVVAGRASNGANIDFALARYNSNGSLDTTFDTDGILTTAIGNNNEAARGVAIQTDGKIVAAGSSDNTSSVRDFAAVRYNTNGSLDSTFGEGGKVTTRVGSGNDEADALAIQPNGKIVLAGYSFNGSNADFAVVRYNADGVPQGSAVTPTGANVSVEPVLSLTVTFANVTQAGNTVALPLASSLLPALPAGYVQLADNPAYDVRTSALFSGNVTVSYIVPNITVPTRCNNMRLLHYEAGGWTPEVNGPPFYNSANQTCTISQTVTSLSPFAITELAQNCSFAISPTTANVVASGNIGGVNVTAPSGCPWTAGNSSVPWLRVNSGSSGEGNGIVTYAYDPNGTSSPRDGTLTIAGQTFTVIQDAGAGCSYTISPISSTFAANGGSGTVNVTAPSGCQWNATSTNSFITPSNGSGSGPMPFNFSVAANTTTNPRVGTITINGSLTFTVVQGGLTPNLRSITLNSPLPPITEPIIIDGAAGNPGFTNGVPVIEINGQNLAAQGGGDGLRITNPASGSTLRSLILNRFASAGTDAAIRFISSSSNIVEGCYIGTNATGTGFFAPPAGTSNSAAGIVAERAINNRIGGTTADKRNLIAGVDGVGILIFDSSTGNLVQGNRIGTDVTGSVSVGRERQRHGVVIRNANNNTIGGTETGAGNLISGAGANNSSNGNGIFLEADARNNLVQGNQIGTNSTGLAPIANGNAGVEIFRPVASATPSMNTIGGTTPAARNIISGNSFGVIAGVGATETQVQGNYIGTGLSGSVALPNAIHGVIMTQATGSTLGGDPINAPNARNVIAGNRQTGVFLGKFTNNQFGITGSTVQNNYIGTNAAGDAALANGQDGIFVEVQSVTNNILNNRIAFNGGNGIRIPNDPSQPLPGPSPTPAFRINLEDNAISDNGGMTGLGVDLGPAGVTDNDFQDPDAGANLLQNFPLLVSSSPNPPAKSLSGTLNSTPNSRYVIRYVLALDCSPTNQPLGFLSGGVAGGEITTNAQGDGTFEFTIPAFPPGLSQVKVTVQATDNGPISGSCEGRCGNTSEFAPCRTIALPLPTPTPSPTPTPATALVQFSATVFTASEATATGAVITVTRSGNTASAVSVEYATADSAATQRTDYTLTSGTLNFAAGETSKTFTVPLTDDFYTEASETLTLALANPSAGAALGTVASATLTITDNDATQPDAPPANEFSRFFVARLNGAAQVPATNSTATGNGTLALNPATTQATVNLSFSGLAGTQTAARIHGAAQVTATAPALFTLPNGTVTNHVLATTTQQAEQLRAGLWYLNLTSNSFPNGEIRGQLLASPVESARFFVRQQYADFLSRLPDQAGEDFWVGQITNAAGTDLNLIKQRRVAVSNAFFFEQEYQQTGAYTYRLYRAAFGNTQPFPNPAGDLDTHPYCTANPTNCQLMRAAHVPAYAKFAADRARLDASQLAATQLALAQQFVARAEFVARYPASLTGPQFVDALLGTLQSSSGVNLSSQRDALITQFNNGGRGAVLSRLAEDNAAGNPINNRAFIDAEYNKAFVVTQYFGYLRRDADLPGLNFWLSVVNQFPLRSATGQNGMVCAFITAREYQERFGPGVTRSNQTDCPQ